MKVIANKSKKSAEIYLYEDIGAGWFGGISSKEFSDILKDLGSDVSQIDLRINSPGGSVFEGVAIYNLLVSHEANVTAHIDGLAASIASIVAMSGNEILMAENAMMMIHDPWGMAIGSAADMRKEADTLETVRDTLVNTYAKRTGAGEEIISELMTEETWMNAEEAVDRGFADEMSEAMKQAACVDCTRYGYKHTPEPKDTVRPLIAAAGTRIAHMGARLRRKGL